MIETDYDSVIIGGGVSGLLAGIYLLEQGFRVAVVSRGDPIACLSTGCVDVLSGTADPMAVIDLLPESHPYRKVGRAGIQEALAYFMNAAASSGLNYTGSPGENRGILTPLGTIKTTCLVPETMAKSPVNRDDGLHVISFAGLKDFYPGYIKTRFRTAEFSVYDAGAKPAMAIAERFESQDFRDAFVLWLKGIDIAGAKIGLPAVLGLSSSSEIMQEIEERIGYPLFEIPTLPPSVPGVRLFRALKTKLLRSGGQLYWGKPIASIEKSGNVIEAATISTRGRATRVNGKTFILATGSFVSGGLDARLDGPAEPVFGLPVHHPAAREDWFGEKFFPPDHPIEQAGIVVDGTFRPAQADLENLFVCGSILAFADIMKRGCGHGTAIATGLAAAKACGVYLGKSPA